MIDPIDQEPADDPVERSNTERKIVQTILRPFQEKLDNTIRVLNRRQNIWQIEYEASHAMIVFHPVHNRHNLPTEQELVETQSLALEIIKDIQGFTLSPAQYEGDENKPINLPNDLGNMISYSVELD